jgi:hypothetical protein
LFAYVHRITVSCSKSKRTSYCLDRTFKLITSVPSDVTAGKGGIHSIKLRYNSVRIECRREGINLTKLGYNRDATCTMWAMFTAKSVSIHF